MRRVNINIKLNGDSLRNDQKAALAILAVMAIGFLGKAFADQNGNIGAVAFGFSRHTGNRIGGPAFSGLGNHL